MINSSVNYSLIFKLYFIVKHTLGISLILLGLIVAFIIYIEHIKNKKEYLVNTPFSKYLDYFYVHNIIAEAITLIALFMLSIGLLMVLRILNFGKTINIWQILNSENKASIFILLGLLFAIINLKVYFSLMSKVLTDLAYKIHLYLSQYEYYYDFAYILWDRDHANISGRFTATSRIRLYIIYLLIDEDEFNRSMSMGYQPREKFYYKTVIYFRAKIATNPGIKRILTFLRGNLWVLVHTERILFRYLPHLMVLAALIYDLKHTEIKYTYYAIFVYVIIMLYRRLRQFIGYTDMHEVDAMLVEYYYKEKVHEKALKLKRVTSWDVYLYGEERARFIKNYVERGYIAEYIDMTYKRANPPFHMHLLFIVITVVYSIFCYNNMSLSNCCMISIPLLLGFILYECDYYYLKTPRYKLICKTTYVILILLAIAICIYVYLSRHTLYLIQDHITVIGFEIPQYFSIEEKITFMKAYLDDCLSKTQLLKEDQEYIRKLWANIKFGTLIGNSSITDLKAYIYDLLVLFVRIEYVYIYNLEDMEMEASKVPVTWKDYAEYIMYIIALVYLKYKALST